MKRLIDWYLTLLGVAISCSSMRAQPVITIAPSPNPQVAIVPVEGSGSSAAAALLAGNPALQAASFFVDNRSSQPILAIIILGSSTNPRRAKPITTRMMMEGFQDARLRPVLLPGSRLLVIPPDELIPEESISRFANLVQKLKRPFGLVEPWFPADSTVNFGIDCIVFASGEVYGPDTEHFMQEVTARKQAADSVLAAINAGDSAALSAMAKQEPQSNDDHFSEWQKRFALHYLDSLSSANPAAQAAQKNLLRAYPVPPHLFRGAN
jgi:hypothetical protein